MLLSAVFDSSSVNVVEGQNGLIHWKMKLLKFNHSTDLLAVQLELVDVQVIFDSSCVNVVEAQNGSQEIFNVFSSSDTNFSWKKVQCIC